MHQGSVASKSPVVFALPSLLIAKGMAFLSVILHCDLDCFYAQVERVRLSLPEDACLAVVQWNSALAVTYPARKYGINRGSNVDEIRKLAGDNVTIVHVETIGGEAAPPSDPDAAPKPEQDPIHTQKVSLARYRKASMEIFRTISACVSTYGAKFEMASIDEAFIDVTAEVDRRVQCAESESRTLPEGTVVVGETLDMLDVSDVRLAHGADIASEVRKKVYDTLSYTLSAGISINKLLSKFASAKNKPNMQTLVPFRAVMALMDDIPLRKLRGLGGKLGTEVEALGVTTAGEATRLSMEELQSKLENHKFAEFVYNSVRGIDDSEVRERDKTKSFLAAKSFKSQFSLSSVEETWIPLLADELAERLMVDSELNNRDAKTLTISFRMKSANSSGNGAMVNASRSAHMPAMAAGGRSNGIVSTAVSILRKVIREEKQFTFPITFVGLTATNFIDRASANESISHYFRALSNEDAEQIARGKAITDSAEQSTLNSEEIHQRRIQESADKALALRLHREQSTHADGTGSKKGGIGKNLTGRGVKRKNRSVNTLDRFIVKKK